MDRFGPTTGCLWYENWHVVRLKRVHEAAEKNLNAYEHLFLALPSVDDTSAVVLWHAHNEATPLT